MAKVSVIIPTYNCGKYIMEAIESVLIQTYKDFEIIVVDDGSTDSTKEIIREYIRNHPGKIKYFYQAKRGPGAARNVGTNQAEGEYIAFLDADDIWYQEKLHKQIEVLENNRDIGFTYCDNKFVDESRGLIDNYMRKTKLVEGNIAIDLFCDHFIMTPAVVMRKSCIDKIGLFDEKLSVGEDYGFFLKLAYSFNAGIVKQKLWGRRVIKGSLSRRDFILDAKNDLKTLKTFLICHPEFFQKHKKKVLIRLSDYHFSFGYRCLESGNNVLGFVQFAHSIRYRPSLKAFKNVFLCFLPLGIREKTKAIYKNRKLCRKLV